MFGVKKPFSVRAKDFAEIANSANQIRLLANRTARKEKSALCRKNRGKSALWPEDQYQDQYQYQRRQL